MKTELGFTGEVHPAACPCHQGHFIVVVFHIHPSFGRVPVGQDMFPTEAIANEQLEATVMAVARVFVESVGLKVDDAQKVTIAHGQEALLMEERLVNNGSSSREDLH